MYTLYIFIQNVEYKWIAPLQTSAHFHKQDSFHRLIESFFRDTTVFHGFHKAIVSLLHVFVFVTYEQDIAAGEDGLHRHIAEGTNKSTKETRTTQSKTICVYCKGSTKYRLPRPLARAWKRFKLGPLSTKIVTTFSSSMSAGPRRRHRTS